MTKAKGFGVTSEDLAAKHVSKINLHTDAGIRVVTPEVDGNCVPVVTGTYEMLSQALDGWTIQAGMVIAYDHTFKEWDSFFQLGHVWMYHEGSGTILDPTVQEWPAQLERLNFRLSPSVFTALRQGLGTEELLPFFDKLKGRSQVQGCDLIYLPGVSGLDYLKARKQAHPEAAAMVRARYANQGENWIEWTGLTKRQGHCTEALMAYAKQTF
jgi:hypothetical protein